MRQDHRTIVLSWLVDILKNFPGTFEERIRTFKSDSRGGTVPGYDSLYCKAEAINQPAETISLKTADGDKELSTFEIDELAKEAEMLMDQENLF